MISTRLTKYRMAHFAVALFLLSFGVGMAAEVVLGKSKGSLIISGTEVLPGNQRTNLLNIVAAADKGVLEIRSLEEPVELVSTAVPGWKAKLKPASTIQIEEEAGIGKTSYRNTSQNALPIIIEFPDGGHLDLRKDSSASVEFFANKSYVARGKGDVRGANGDGLEVKFDRPISVLRGGPLLLQQAEDKPAGWRRASTISSITLGVTNGTIQVKSEKEQIEINAEGMSNFKIQETGTEIAFERLRNGTGVKFQVVKGDIRFAVEKISSWTALAESGQSGVISWNPNTLTVDVENLSMSPMLIELPLGAVAIAEAKSIFQYGIVPGKMYSTSAAQGNVYLYSEDGRLGVNLRNQNQLFRSTLVREVSRKEGIPIYLNWDNGAPLRLSASVAFAEMRPGTEHILRFGNDIAAKFNYSDGGFLKMEAINHKFSLVVEALNGLLVDVEGGDSVSMILDRRKGTFTLITGADNSFPVGVDTQTGFSPSVGANRSINFNIKQDGTLAATQQGSLMFFLPGREDPLSMRFDFSGLPDRVDQPPISVVR